MNEKYIMYQIESIVNKKLYEKQVIDYDDYKSIENKMMKLIFDLEKNDLLKH